MLGFSLFPDLGCQQCANGWLTYGRSCFYLSTFRLSWDESQKNCTARGGSLAVITNQSVQVELMLLNFWSHWLVSITIRLKKMLIAFVCVNINALSSRISWLRRENWITGLGWDAMDKNGPGPMGLSCNRGYLSTCYFLLIDCFIFVVFSCFSCVFFYWGHCWVW